MKSLYLPCCCAFALATAIAVVVLRTNAQSETAETVETAETEALTLESFLLPGADRRADIPYGPDLNTETWELVWLDGKPVEGELNTEERKLERYYADLAVANPEEYERLFPTTPQMQGVIKKALKEAENPKSLEEHLREIKDPKQSAEIQISIEGILNPEPVDEEIAKALEASPAGPWSNVIRP